MKRRKWAIMTALVMTMSIGLTPCYADSVKESVPIVQSEGKGYVPMKALIEKMSGNVERFDGEVDHYTTYEMGDKSIRIWDEYACSFINGSYVPFETQEVQGFTVPAWYIPTQSDGDVMVPVTFVEKNLGVKIEGDEVTFEVTKKEEDSGKDSTATNSGTTNNTSNSGSSEVSTHNRPTSNNNTGSNTNTGSGSTTKPTKPTKPSEEESTDTGQTTPTPTPTPPQKVYTGSQVKQNLYGLGFFDRNGGLVWTPDGSFNGATSVYADYSVAGGDIDMVLNIYNSDTAFDQKLRTIFGYILPSSGGSLYSIVDNANVQSQTVTLDGRQVQIAVTGYGLTIKFGPMIK